MRPEVNSNWFEISLRDKISLLLSEYPYFYKIKHVKCHAERPQYQFHPGVEVFSFQPEVKGTCIAKKIHRGLKFHSGVNFTSPTCNIPLRTCLHET